MYRNDDEARTERATLLIDEIAKLEREKLAHEIAERRLEDAKRELAMLRPAPAATARSPGVVAHVLVGCIAACATFTAYTLLFGP
jgi:hypothetical protein